MHATPAPAGTARLLPTLLWPVSIYNMESSLEDSSSVRRVPKEEDSDNMKMFKQQKGCVSHPTSMRLTRLGCTCVGPFSKHSVRTANGSGKADEEFRDANQNKCKE